MHKDIKDSGLSEMYKIRPVTSNTELSKFLGKRVRYKAELLDADFVKKHGSLVKSETFVIREVQKNCDGEDCLRGYFDGDTFGRAINPEHVEIVE